MSKPDKVYSEQQKQQADFVFDEAVAEVFPDMIKRSVPGYETIISMIGAIADRYTRKGSNVYDLGCSVGAATLSLHRCLEPGRVHYICVDKSQEMLERCAVNLQAFMPTEEYTLLNEDILSVDICGASLVLMNFTLQFIMPEQRDNLIRKIYDGLIDGGILLLSEKTKTGSVDEDQFMVALHEQYKKTHGYSELEISQKRTALENVMVLDSVEGHLQRLEVNGFNPVYQWFQDLNFRSFMAVKPGAVNNP